MYAHIYENNYAHNYAYVKHHAPDQGIFLNPGGRARTTGGLTHVQVIDRTFEFDLGADFRRPARQAIHGAGPPQANRGGP
jgi:hypothetical protein